MKILAALAFLAALAGCAASGPAYQPAPEPGQGQALVYIFRPLTMAGYSSRDAYFFVDNQNVANLSNGGYSWVHMPAGEYRLTMRWPPDITLGRDRDVILPARWTAGRKYFYRMDVSSKPAAGGTLHQWRIVAVPPDTGEKEIACCKYQPAKPPDQRGF